MIMKHGVRVLRRTKTREHRGSAAKVRHFSDENKQVVGNTSTHASSDKSGCKMIITDEILKVFLEVT